MTMPTRSQMLDEAVGLTHAMIELAQADEWQQVIDTEAQRRRLLEQAFATYEPLSEALAAKVRHILELDKGLLEISTRLRDEIGGEIGQVSRGNRANHAYQANMA